MHTEEDNSHHIFKMSPRLVKSAWKKSWTSGKFFRFENRIKEIQKGFFLRLRTQTEEQKEQSTFSKPENLSWQELNLGPFTTRLCCNPGLASESSEIQYQLLINNLWNLLKNYYLFQQLTTQWDPLHQRFLQVSLEDLLLDGLFVESFLIFCCQMWFCWFLNCFSCILFFLPLLWNRIFVQDLLFHHSFKIGSFPWLLTFLAPLAPELIPLYLWTLPLLIHLLVLFLIILGFYHIWKRSDTKTAVCTEYTTSQSLPFHSTATERLCRYWKTACMHVHRLCFNVMNLNRAL